MICTLDGHYRRLEIPLKAGLTEDSIKMEIIQLLQWLTAKELISVHVYVIMPNHIHLLWELNAPNGEELAKGS